MYSIGDSRYTKFIQMMSQVDFFVFFMARSNLRAHAFVWGNDEMFFFLSKCIRLMAETYDV